MATADDSKSVLCICCDRKVVEVDPKTWKLFNEMVPKERYDEQIEPVEMTHVKSTVLKKLLTYSVRISDTTCSSDAVLKTWMYDEFLHSEERLTSLMDLIEAADLLDIESLDAGVIQYVEDKSQEEISYMMRYTSRLLMDWTKKVFRLMPNWKRDAEVRNLEVTGYKVYGNPFSTSTRRVLAVLLEKGLSYESITVDLKSGEHKTESFLSLNVSNVIAKKNRKYMLHSHVLSFNLVITDQPFGQIPVFVDGNIKLHESRAITQYIAYVHSASGTQLLYLQSHETMAILTVWMEIEAHQFDPFASKLTWEQAIKPIYGLETDQEVVKENEACLEKVLDVYEKRLGKYRFLACNTFTLADLHHLPNIQYLLGTPTKRLFEDRPKVRKWVGEITGREAWKMACDHEKYWFGKQMK
ncbi:hypothetical protein Bca4012_008409 [Brassica carinata]